MKKCSYCGKEYPDEAQVCSIDLQALNAVLVASSSQATSKLSAEERPGPVLIYKIKMNETARRPRTVIMKAEINFGRPASAQEFSSRNLRFQGRGSIEVGSDWIVFSGKRRWPFRFGRKATVEIKLREIVNVDRSGRHIRFALRSSAAGPKAKMFSFRVNTEPAAEQIESLLPKAQTTEFAQAKYFEARLRAATPHVFIVPALILINVLVFLVMALAGAPVPAPDTHPVAKLLRVNSQLYIDWGANFGPLTTHGQWWRLLTCTFLHCGIKHLLLNMAVLYAFGQFVERLYGNASFLILYVAAGVTGSVASVWWHPAVWSVGASGAIFGIYGGLLAYLLAQGKSVPPLVRKPLRKSTLVLVAYSLVVGFLCPHIDNAAHLGGLAGGAVMGLILAHPLRVAVKKKMARSGSPPAHLKFEVGPIQSRRDARQ